MGIFQIINPIIEILIITTVINYLLSFFWNTRSMDLMLGLVAFLLIFAFSSLLPFPVLHQIMLLVSNVAVIAFIVIFQPELRVALSKLSLKGRKYHETSDSDKFLDQLTTAVYQLAERNIGALIAIERSDSLNEYANKAVILNAEFTPELLDSIFQKTSKLHDGCVIIQNQKLIAAGAILPLAEQVNVASSVGTRHRAALGLSGVTDALVIVVSEEYGKVSIAREDVMSRAVKIDRCKAILRSLLCRDEIKPPSKKRMRILDWVKR